MTAGDLSRLLRAIGACGEAMDWAAGRDLATAWGECPRGDWLLWLAGYVRADRRLVVRAAVACARPALRYVPPGEDRPRIALDLAEAWTRGEVTLDEVRTAASNAAAASAAAYAAADAAAADAAAAAYAAYAAAAYAAAAYAAAAYAAYAAAAYAAADAAAADAGETSRAAEAARAAALAASADTVRGIIPIEAVEAAAKAKLATIEAREVRQ